MRQPCRCPADTDADADAPRGKFFIIGDTIDNHLTFCVSARSAKRDRYVMRALSVNSFHSFHPAASWMYPMRIPMAPPPGSPMQLDSFDSTSRYICFQGKSRQTINLHFTKCIIISKKELKQISDHMKIDAHIVLKLWYHYIWDSYIITLPVKISSTFALFV